MTNVTLSRMFRGKVRSNTCRIIILTSIVWLLIDVVVLMRYADLFNSSSSSTGRKPGEYEVEVSFQKSICLNYRCLRYLQAHAFFLWFRVEMFYDELRYVKTVFVWRFNENHLKSVYTVLWK